MTRTVLAAFVCCRCLTAMARFKEVAPHLLQRLVSAAVVNAGPAPMEYAGGQLWHVHVALPACHGHRLPCMLIFCDSEPANYKHVCACTVLLS